MPPKFMQLYRTLQKEKGKKRVYLRLLKTSAAAATATMITAAATAMYSVIDGASLLGGGATEGDTVTEGETELDGEGDVV